MSKPQIRVFLNIRSITDGHEEQIEIANPSANHLTLAGHQLLVTQVTVQPMAAVDPGHRASCHGPIGEIQCSGPPEHR